MVNNIFLVISAFMVLAGTLAPLLVDAISGTKISVGPPYFDFMFALLTIPLAIVVGIGSTSRWKRDHLSRYSSKTLTMLILALH